MGQRQSASGAPYAVTPIALEEGNTNGTLALNPGAAQEVVGAQVFIRKGLDKRIRSQLAFTVDNVPGGAGAVLQVYGRTRFIPDSTLTPGTWSNITNFSAISPPSTGTEEQTLCATAQVEHATGEAGNIEYQLFANVSVDDAALYASLQATGYEVRG